MCIIIVIMFFAMFVHLINEMWVAAIVWASYLQKSAFHVKMMSNISRKVKTACHGMHVHTLMVGTYVHILCDCYMAMVHKWLSLRNVYIYLPFNTVIGNANMTSSYRNHVQNISDISFMYSSSRFFTSSSKAFEYFFLFYKM